MSATSLPQSSIGLFPLGERPAVACCLVETVDQKKHDSTSCRFGRTPRLNHLFTKESEHFPFDNTCESIQFTWYFGDDPNQKHIRVDFSGVDKPADLVRKIEVTWDDLRADLTAIAYSHGEYVKIRTSDDSFVKRHPSTGVAMPKTEGESYSKPFCTHPRLPTLSMGPALELDITTFKVADVATLLGNICASRAESPAPLVYQYLWKRTKEQLTKLALKNKKQ